MVGSIRDAVYTMKIAEGKAAGLREAAADLRRKAAGIPQDYARILFAMEDKWEKQAKEIEP